MRPTPPPTTNYVDLYIRLSNKDDGADSLVRQETDLRAWAALS